MVIFQVCYPPPRGTPDAGIAYDIGAMQMHQGTPPHSVPVRALASLLANASPAEQRMVVDYLIDPFVSGVNAGDPDRDPKKAGTNREATSSYRSPVLIILRAWCWHLHLKNS
ncbi:hypothetical protein POM88_017029 [Heracleum sosnowskyi]|uniref:Uncharacterized protein n=1 Tax=Heracleum sosnowskyi TaxID=360622 RepID=A0AAD8INR4_9APIA|nr:hypothetical protein POM88_017029 [Heracleum sosnowskyi]